MSRVVTTTVVDAARADAAMQPREGFVQEAETGTGRFTAAMGPVRAYERVVAVEPLPDGRRRVTQTVDYRLAIPYFAILFHPLVRLALRSTARRGREPTWFSYVAPPDQLDARGSTVLATVAAAAVITGYLNTLLSQTLTFAADEFGSSDTAQGAVGVAVRIGGTVAFLLVAMADRRGRRPVLLFLLGAGCATAATGALAPNLAGLAASQTVARMLATALVGVIPIVTAEELPKGARAWGIGLVAMAGALGAGLCVLSLPLADLGETGWRWVYVPPLLGLLLLPGIARRMPETRRFERPHPEATLRSHGQRFWLLAIALFLSNLFVAPHSVFSNRYLDKEVGLSASGITALTVFTNTPAGLAILFAGRWADRHGRRRLAALAVVVGTVACVAYYWASGWPLWVLSFTAAWMNGVTVPTMGVYGPELFPTGLRGRATGLIGVAGLAGSAIGLLVAGAGSDAFGRLGPTLAILALGPMVVAVLLVTRFPETARVELEELNPEDQLPAGADGAVR